MIRGAFALEPDDRLSPALRRARGRVTVRATQLRPRQDPALEARLRELGVRVQGRTHFGTWILELDAGGLLALAAIEEWEWIEPAPQEPAPEMVRARRHAGATSGTTAAPLYGLTGAGVEVSVHDAGHVFAHPDLAARLRQGDSQPSQVSLHATMTAGAIAADGSLQPLFAGMASSATVVSFSFASPPPCCEVNHQQDVATAIAELIPIANNSWGYPGCAPLPYGEYTTAAELHDRWASGLDGAATAVGAPALVVFSAGNERHGIGGDPAQTGCIQETRPPYRNYGTLNQPKPAKNTLVVGAIDSLDDAMSSYSSWGPTADGRIKPDLVAGGSHAATSTAEVRAIDNCFGAPVGGLNQQCYRAANSSASQFGGYAWFSQTSAAAAIVSGAAALLLEELRASAPAAEHPSLLRGLLIHRARDLDDATSWYNPGPDYASGFGAIDLAAALDQLRAEGHHSGCLDAGERHRWWLPVPPGTPQVKLTLLWDDPPASPLSGAPALLNDLELEVFDAEGTRRWPYRLDPAQPAAGARRDQADHLNNLEQVEVSTRAGDRLPAGTWRVEVATATVALPPQCYVLLLTPAANDDADGDGHRARVDCDDAAATVFAGAPAICDGRSNDCGAAAYPSLAGTEEADDDGDGFSECEGDCDDGDPATYPGAAEICDLVRNDCSAAGWPGCPGDCPRFCDDGDPCTLADHCQGSTCTSTTPLPCGVPGCSAPCDAGVAAIDAEGSDGSEDAGVQPEDAASFDVAAVDADPARDRADASSGADRPEARADAVSRAEAGAAGDAAGAGPAEGCGCATARRRSGGSWAALGWVLLLVPRRRHNFPRSRLGPAPPPRHR